MHFTPKIHEAKTNRRNSSTIIVGDFNAYFQQWIEKLDRRSIRKLKRFEEHYEPTRSNRNI